MPRSFVDALKTDQFKDTVFCFTPKGKLIELPAGSTILDFAYRIHTDIGDHCRGGKVNGIMVPLTYKLKNGDQLEVITRPNATPSRDWLHDPVIWRRTPPATRCACGSANKIAPRILRPGARLSNVS